MTCIHDTVMAGGGGHNAIVRLCLPFSVIFGHLSPDLASVHYLRCWFVGLKTEYRSPALDTVPAVTTTATKSSCLAAPTGPCYRQEAAVQHQPLPQQDPRHSAREQSHGRRAAMMANRQLTLTLLTLPREEYDADRMIENTVRIP